MTYWCTMASQTEIDQIMHKVDFGNKMKIARRGTMELEMFWDGWNLALENVMLIMKINGDKPS